ncbi:MAG: SDR family NAD(P)-dependent oxidoreductase [Flavobacteriia bacterium]|nr:SDR family NAD(P)-dependent oxidoreductase [Flavobacteriia bacterium]
MHRRILLTGASGGLGLIIAELLLQEGHFVYLHCHSHPNALQPLCKKYPSHTKMIAADLLVDEDLNVLFQSTEDVNVLIHAAGIASAGMSWKVPKEEFEKVNHINYFAPFYLSQFFIPTMRKNSWGRIIFFSSVVAQKGIPGTSAYAASKSALIGLSRTMASELGAAGITVNTIAPGYMDTGMIREISEEMRTELLKSIPSRELGNSKNIAELVSFILKDNANYINGQTISVNGGMV